MNVTVEIKELGDTFYLNMYNDEGATMFSPAWKRKTTAERWATRVKNTNEQVGIPTKIIDLTNPIV